MTLRAEEEKGVKAVLERTGESRHEALRRKEAMLPA